MSARCIATFFEDEKVEVEISGDGKLTIVDHDIEYDIAFVAMGGEKTPAVRLMDIWLKNPADVICYNLGLEDNTLMLLAADWAEHVLPIFEKVRLKDKRPRLAIEATRDFVSGKITAAQLDKAHQEAIHAAVKMAEEWPGTGAVAAAWSAAYAAWAAAAWAWNKAADWARRSTATDPHLEQAWQVRRFVHVMECLQAGKPWPPLEATK